MGKNFIFITLEGAVQRIKQVVGERDENCIPNFETTRQKIRLNFKAAREKNPNERAEEIWNQLYERMKKILEKLWDEKKSSNKI